MKHYVFYGVLSAVVLADVITKTLVRQNLSFGSSLDIFRFLALTHTTNTGTLFGILHGYNLNALFIVITLGILGAIGVSLYRTKWNVFEQVAWGLVAGGAFGNVIDRIFFGAVTDFIDLKVWPVFNVADAGISVGVALLLWQELAKRRNS